jgi:DNA invertase Pin-like site-specific DNA recombinase
VLGSIAIYETEVRAQRILAGQEAARARGIRWGGSERGRRVKVTAELEAKVKRLRPSNKSPCNQGLRHIDRTLFLSAA